MSEYLLLGGMAAVLLLLFLLRTNTGIVFLTLCAGTLLLSATGSDVSLFASSLSSGASASSGVAKIALLTLPALCLAAFLRKQIPRHKWLFGIVPGVAAALLAPLLIVPLLSGGVQGSIGSTDTWDLLTQYQGTIVAVGVIASIITIAFTVSKPHDKDKHKKGRHH